MTQFVHKVANTYLDMPTDYWVPTTSRLHPMRSNQFEQTLEEKQDERSEVEKEQTTVSKEEKAILKEGSIIGIIEIPGIDIRYPVMEETGSEMLNAGTGNNAFYCQVQI
jgi:sortase A